MYPMFLYGHIGEMHKHVINLGHVWGVLYCTEPAEPQLISERDHMMSNGQTRIHCLHVCFQWPVRCDKYVETKVKLLPTNQQWILNVSRYNIDLL